MTPRQVSSNYSTDINEAYVTEDYRANLADLYK